MPGRTPTRLPLVLSALAMMFTGVQSQTFPGAETTRTLGRTNSTTGQPTPPVNAGEFVTRAGSTLLLAGREFRFAGSNEYFLQPEMAYRNEAGVREVLDKAVTLGLTVVRAHGFNDHPVPGDDPAVIQSAPGVFIETNLVALDKAVAEARARNLRLIFNLTNNWTAYGGIRRYVQWKLNRAPAPDEYGLFYTDETIKGWFKGYVSMLLNRTNTVTGLKYKDDPAIMAWELGNELRNGGNANALLAWEIELASYIKSIDPNHLVADGGEGFDDNAALYAGISNSYAVRGDEGCSFHRMVNIPDIDLVSYHLYPSNWGLNDTTDVEIWIRVHQQLARAPGKVAYLGEFGKRAGGDPPNCDRAIGRQFDSERAQIFERWLKLAWAGNLTSGQMVWQLFYDARPDCDGFAVYYPEDTQTTTTLKKYATAMNHPPLATVSAASYIGPIVAAESIVSAFGVELAPRVETASSRPLPNELAGVKVMVTDSMGREWAAPLFFVSTSQINYQIPPSAVSGGALAKVLRDGQLASSGTITIMPIAPGLFSANSDGHGVAAALALRMREDGAQSYEPVAQFDQALNKFVAMPIDLGVESEQVFLILYGTGLHFRSEISAVKATVGGEEVEVLYAGEQGDFVGLDQANVRLSHGLKGRGELEVTLKVDGKSTNTVRINVK
jgi:uncharacterized protein (TIGR03437 family)